MPPLRAYNPHVWIVALTGAARIGKSTAADHLVVTHGFTRLSLATPLKDMLKALGLSEAHISGPEKATPLSLLCGHTPRHAMQTLGTEWRDLLDPRLWVQVLVHRIQALPAPLLRTHRIVIDDVRFPHELEALREAGFLVDVVRITKLDQPVPGLAGWLARKGWTRRLRAILPRDLILHESEAWWPVMPATVEVDNSGSLKDLHRSLNRVVNELSPH